MCVCLSELIFPQASYYADICWMFDVQFLQVLLLVFLLTPPAFVVVVVAALLLKKQFPKSPLLWT